MRCSQPLVSLAEHEETTLLTLSAPPRTASTAVGLRCKDGVVLVRVPAGQPGCACVREHGPDAWPCPLASLLAKGVEKLVLSKMLCEGSCRRIHNVDRHAGLVRHAAPALCVCVT